MPTETRSNSKKRSVISPTQGQEQEAADRPAKKTLHGSANVMANPLTLTDLHKLLKNEITSSKEEIQTDIKGVQRDLRELKQDVDEVKASQVFINKEFETFRENLTSLSGKVEQNVAGLATLQHGQLHVTSQLGELNNALNDVKQEQLANNVLISNVIKTVPEDLSSVLIKICETLNVHLFDRDVVSITRLMSKNTKQIEPILVQFSNRVVKEKIISAAKNITLSCRNLGFDIDQRIYINHHLTPHNQVIMQAARNFKNKNGFRFAWFARGKIFIKRDETSATIRICKEEDLLSIKIA